MKKRGQPDCADPSKSGAVRNARRSFSVQQAGFSAVLGAQRIQSRISPDSKKGSPEWKIIYRDATHRTSSEILDQTVNLIDSHGGQVVHYAGNAVLAKFDAVEILLDGMTVAGLPQVDRPDAACGIGREQVYTQTAKRTAGN